MFRPPEVIQAVKEYRRRLGMPLPAGTVMQCGPECEPGPAARLRFSITLLPDPVKGSDATPPAQQIVVIDGHDLAAALILYCRDRHIPIPVGADKSLERLGNQVCLVATLNSKQSDMPQLDQIRL